MQNAHVEQSDTVHPTTTKTYKRRRRRKAAQKAENKKLKTKVNMMLRWKKCRKKQWNIHFRRDTHRSYNNKNSKETTKTKYDKDWERIQRWCLDTNENFLFKGFFVSKQCIFATGPTTNADVPSLIKIWNNTWSTKETKNNAAFRQCDVNKKETRLIIKRLAAFGHDNH